MPGSRRRSSLLAFAVILATPAAAARQPFFDRTHDSRVFGQPRHYRLFQPSDYDTSGRHYPVIYYFHGHSDRYTLEHYDGGRDTAPRISEFAARNNVIVVAVDGYVPENYTGFYGGTPWDLMKDGGAHDFGLYFLELVEHIDATCRTLTGRRHRATSGLSMGGFMSLWLSARYPDRIGSASAFNPGPEFYAGEPGRRVLWRPRDHVSSHAQSMIRLVRASGDYISQYHEETREAYARTPGVDFEFRQDEYHRHWATSIEETLAFHLRAFERAELDRLPETWSHDDAYRRFSVWGYDVSVEGEGAGFTCLTHVRQGGFRISTRRWAPDGPPVSGRRIRVVTPPLYAAGEQYVVLDHNLATGRTVKSETTASAGGRLTVTVDGAGHHVSFAGPGTGAEPPVLLPVTTRDYPRFVPGREVELPVRVYNPRNTAMTGVRVSVTSEYPTAALLTPAVTVDRIEAGATADVRPHVRCRFTSGAGDFSRVRFDVKLTYDGWHEAADVFDVLVIPDVLPAPAALEILDGRTVTFHVFRQKGNQGGGAAFQRTVTEGKGNANGILEPGEEATIWVKLAQGMDPFDKNTWHRAKVYGDSPWLAEVEDLEEQKGLEWTGAKERTSVVRLSPDTPPGSAIPLVLSNESWSYHFTPDVRYGREPLYQAFQLHTRHLHGLTLRTPQQ